MSAGGGWLSWCVCVVECGRWRGVSIVYLVVKKCVCDVIWSPYSSVVEHSLRKRKVGSSILPGGSLYFSFPTHFTFILFSCVSSVFRTHFYPAPQSRRRTYLLGRYQFIRSYEFDNVYPILLIRPSCDVYGRTAQMSTRTKPWLAYIHVHDLRCWYDV